jgi:uncharacterized membrane protein YeiB
LDPIESTTPHAITPDAVTPEAITTEPIGPVPGDARITVIDCLRGAALFGILTANMRGFNAPLAAYMDTRLMWTWLPDRIAQALVDSYGLGLYGRVGPLADLFLGVVIYAAQIPVSKWWLSTHRYGPMEWIWRRLTYGRVTASAVP